jgi:anti-anti-sigma factor
MASGQLGLVSWTIEHSPGTSAVTISGEIDLSVADGLKSALYGSPGLEERVQLDLREVTFIDSIGLRLLLELKRAIEAAGGDLVLTSVSAAVSRVLDVSGTALYFASHAKAHAAPLPGVAELAG